MKTQKVDIEKDLQSKKFKKDPFSSKYQDFLISDVVTTFSSASGLGSGSGCGDNPDKLGMNLQLRSEVIKAQLQNLLCETKEASVKFLSKESESKKIKKKGVNPSKITDENKKIDLDDESMSIRNNRGGESCRDKDEHRSLVDSKMILLQSLSDVNVLSQECLPTRCTSAKLTQVVIAAVACPPLSTLFNDSDMQSELRIKSKHEPLSSSDVEQSIENQRVPLGLSEIQSSTSTKRYTDLSKYLKYILPFSFPATEDIADIQPTDCYESVNMDERQGDYCNLSHSNTFPGQEYDIHGGTSFENGIMTPQSDGLEGEENRESMKVCSKRKRQRLHRTTIDDDFEDIGDGSKIDRCNNPTTENIKSASCPLKPKMSKTIKMKDSLSLSSTKVGHQVNGQLLKVPILSKLLKHRQQHCTALQCLINKNPGARKKLQDIAAKRMTARITNDNRSGEDAMKFLLPLPQHCPSPPHLFAHHTVDGIDLGDSVHLLPDDAYSMPYSVTMLDLNMVHPNQRVHMCKWPAYVDCLDEINLDLDPDECISVDRGGFDSEGSDCNDHARWAELGERHHEMESFRVDQTGGFVVNQATGGVVMVDDEDDDVNHTENNWQWFDSDAAEESGHIGSNTSNGLHDDSFADMGCVTVDYVVPDDISNINDGAHDEKPFHSITTEFSDLSSHVTSAYMVNLSTPSSLITAHRSRLLSTLRYLPSLQQLQCYLHRILPQPLIGNMTVRLDDIAREHVNRILLKNKRIFDDSTTDIGAAMVSACSRRTMVALVFLIDNYNRQYCNATCRTGDESFNDANKVNNEAGTNMLEQKYRQIYMSVTTTSVLDSAKNIHYAPSTSTSNNSITLYFDADDSLT